MTTRTIQKLGLALLEIVLSGFLFGCPADVSMLPSKQATTGEVFLPNKCDLEKEYKILNVSGSSNVGIKSLAVSKTSYYAALVDSTSAWSIVATPSRAAWDLRNSPKDVRWGTERKLVATAGKKPILNSLTAVGDYAFAAGYTIDNILFSVAVDNGAPVLSTPATGPISSTIPGGIPIGAPVNGSPLTFFDFRASTPVVTGPLSGNINVSGGGGVTLGGGGSGTPVGGGTGGGLPLGGGGGGGGIGTESVGGGFSGLSSSGGILASGSPPIVVTKPVVVRPTETQDLFDIAAGGIADLFNLARDIDLGLLVRATQTTISILNSADFLVEHMDEQGDGTWNETDVDAEGYTEFLNSTSIGATATFDGRFFEAHNVTTLEIIDDQTSLIHKDVAIFSYIEGEQRGSGLNGDPKFKLQGETAELLETDTLSDEVGSFDEHTHYTYLVTHNFTENYWKLFVIEPDGSVIHEAATYIPNDGILQKAMDLAIDPNGAVYIAGAIKVGSSYKMHLVKLGPGFGDYDEQTGTTFEGTLPGGVSVASQSLTAVEFQQNVESLFVGGVVYNADGSLIRSYVWESKDAGGTWGKPFNIGQASSKAKQRNVALRALKQETSTKVLAAAFEYRNTSGTTSDSDAVVTLFPCNEKVYPTADGADVWKNGSK